MNAEAARLLAFAERKLADAEKILAKDLGKFLADGFEIKSAADYADGAPVEKQDAEDAIATAQRFLAAARRVLL